MGSASPVTTSQSTAVAERNAPAGTPTAIPSATGTITPTSVAPTPQDQPSPTATPSPTPTPTPTPPPTPHPTAMPSPTPTPVPVTDGGEDARWAQAIHTSDGGIVGVVTTESLNVRAAPSLGAPVVDTKYAGHPVVIRQTVQGDQVNGNATWYRIGDGRFIASTFVEPLAAAKPPRTFAGHWVDISLSTFYAIAYDGDRPVYAAIITAGRGNKTPLGVFQIERRVRDETMDSATVGIPKGDPEYYYLINVQFTQYFKEGGYGLHGNYWTPPSNFGGFTSNGCVGLQNSDAEWFWNFLSLGSTVSIHD